jgi:hypothetical protein
MPNGEKDEFKEKIAVFLICYEIFGARNGK